MSETNPSHADDREGDRKASDLATAEDRAVTRSGETEDPPGLPAIRRFFDRAWIRGVWAWMRFLGRGVGRAFGFVARNAGTVGRGIERVGSAAARVARHSTRAGRHASDIGEQLDDWGGALVKTQGRGGRFGSRLRSIGRGLRGLGRRAVGVGGRSSGVFESVSDLGEALSGDEDSRSAPRSAKSKKKSLPDAKPVIADTSPDTSAPKTAVADDRIGTPAPVPGVADEMSVASAAVSDEPPSGGSGLPETILARIRGLGKRRRSGPLRRIILDICALREWTTVAELGEWLGMDATNLQKRHLRPMLKSGKLALRHPEQVRHPEQAYRALAS